MTNGRVWVTGAGGLIGSALVRTAATAGRKNVVGLTRQVLNLTDRAAVQQRFEQERPVLVFHCAALSKTPACTADPALARKLNVEVTTFLAELASDIPLFFLSTDLVFDGKEGNYVETAAVNPLSIYAETKVEAEAGVRKNSRHTIVRTSLNGGTSPTGDRGFNEELRQAWREGKTLRLFTDEFRSPIAAQLTADVLWQLAEAEQPGLYHLAGGRRMSRWEIGTLLAARWPELKPGIEPGSLKDYQGAPRPPDTSLDCRKLEGLLHIKLPGLPQWLEEHPAEVF